MTSPENPHRSVNAILATDLRGNIGYSGSLPWKHNLEDMKWFVEKTTNHIVVMGRKTWDDPKMPKPLPNRINVVVTSKLLHHPSVTTVTFDGLEKKIKLLMTEFPDKKVFIVGGKKLFESCKHLYDTIHWTQIRTLAQRSDCNIDMHTFLEGFQLRTVVPMETCTAMIYKKQELTGRYIP